jgi:hypothetical protein
VGEYRRAVKSYADKDFFDPDNAEAMAVLKYELYLNSNEKIK